MNILLIIREELVCLIILSYLFFYSHIYSKGEQKRFIRACTYVMGHVIFDIITVITVNSNVHPTINWICHIIFYYFALMFCYELFKYCISLVMKPNKKVNHFFDIVTTIALLIIPFCRIDYLQGDGTMYSFGPAVYLGYSLAFIYSMGGLLVLTIKYRKVDKTIKATLFPLIICLNILLLIQVLVPEFLFTGAALTIGAVGLFFAIENPILKFRKRLFIDYSTGVKNRNYFDEEKISLNQFCFEEGKDVAVIMFDINGLKDFNDKYGHLEGDNLIKYTAATLLEKLRNAHDIYRFGGDEFIAIYIGNKVAFFRQEIEEVKNVCNKKGILSCDENYSLDLAIGYYIKNEKIKDINELIDLADRNMYNQKERMKSEKVF